MRLYRLKKSAPSPKKIPFFLKNSAKTFTSRTNR
jgi:hypothetical protein